MAPARFGRRPRLLSRRSSHAPPTANRAILSQLSLDPREDFGGRVHHLVVGNRQLLHRVRFGLDVERNLDGPLECRIDVQHVSPDRRVQCDADDRDDFGLFQYQNGTVFVGCKLCVRG